MFKICGDPSKLAEVRHRAPTLCFAPTSQPHTPNSKNASPVGEWAPPGGLINPSLCFSTGIQASLPRCVPEPRNENINALLHPALLRSNIVTTHPKCVSSGGVGTPWRPLWHQP